MTLRITQRNLSLQESLQNLFTLFIILFVSASGRRLFAESDRQRSTAFNQHMLTLLSCVRRPCTLLYCGKERKSKSAKPHIRSADVSDPLLIFTMNISWSVQSEMGLLKSVNSKQTSIMSNKGVRVKGFDVSCL